MSTFGNISDIKHYALNDGPGIRLTVFLKGCPLACAWCHNPESISPEREIMYFANRCIHCGECTRACPQAALRAEANRIVRERTRCTLCGACTASCPTRALEMVGRTISDDDLLTLIEKDRLFFEHSGGGVTFSGGEPLMQPAFLGALLQGCRQRRIHTAVDTSGYGDSAELLKIAESTDLFLFDLKLADPARHLQWTGVGTDTIHRNLQLLAAAGASILFRLPLIHGVNCDAANLEKTAQLITALPGGNRTLDLLPWHNTAQRKYAQLELDYRHAQNFSAPEADEVSAAVQLFAQYGINAQVQ